MSKNKPTIFRGAATALITPFKDGKIDYGSLARIIDFNVREGIDALVIAGTTGEAPTLTDQEHRQLIRFAVEQVAGRVPLIAGTGSNCTEHACLMTEYACDVGCDGVLVITPYYNKATPDGLVAHFSEIAHRSKKPVILYNVPSRTGCNITLPVYKKLAEIENITGIKEASGNISAVAELIAECGDDFDVYSGNDDQTIPIMSLGGIGVISVLSNILPRYVHSMCDLWLNSCVSNAQSAQIGILPLIKALFCEVNPIPIKAAMSELGYCSDEIRLPLTKLSKNNRELLIETMKKYGLTR